MESAHLIELETTFVWKWIVFNKCWELGPQILCIWVKYLRNGTVGWLILTIFHQINNQNYGYIPQIELLVVPCYNYQQVLWIRSNFDSNSSVNELKNDEINDSSSTNYCCRRYPAKSFVISWWWFLTCSQCDVSEQEVCSPDFTFASK